MRDLHAEFATRLAYTTVMTTMDRLYKKGMLQRRKVGKAFIYVAALTEQEYQEQLTHHLFGMVLHDGKNSGAVLSNFVDAVSDTDEKLLAAAGPTGKSQTAHLAPAGVTAMFYVLAIALCLAVLFLVLACASLLSMPAGAAAAEHGPFGHTGHKGEPAVCRAAPAPGSGLRCDVRSGAARVPEV